MSYQCMVPGCPGEHASKWQVCAALDAGRVNAPSGTTSEPVATEPQGSAGESPALIVCNCAAVPPTMPTYRTHHLPICPVWALENRANVAGEVEEPVTLRTSNPSAMLDCALSEMEEQQKKAADHYFRLRPQLLRSLDQEALFRAGFEHAFVTLWRPDRGRSSDETKARLQPSCKHDWVGDARCAYCVLEDHEAVLSECESLLHELLDEDGVDTGFDDRLTAYWEKSKAAYAWRSRDLKLVPESPSKANRKPWTMGGDPVGTCLQGHAPFLYSRIVEVFGEPTRVNLEEGSRVVFEWVMTFEDGTVATIYEYKSSSLYGDGDDAPTPEEMKKSFTDWHIGGKNKRAVELIHSALNGSGDSA